MTQPTNVDSLPFPDGLAALAAAREKRPDLVLTDVMMPRLDGFGLLRELRSDVGTRTVPVILLQLINDVLDLSKVEAGKMEFVRSR